MQYVDPNSFYSEELESWSTYWNDSLTIWENVQNLFNECILLPDHDIQLPVLVAYSLVNQKWAKALPILFLNGVSGSAKSQVIKINKALHNCGSIQGPDCTFVSLRNEIKRQYWLDEEAGFVRDGAMLLFDNVWERTFLNDDNLLSMLLRSYELSNAVVTTSSQTFGENTSYQVFSSKIISSVQTFNSPKLHEIHRRVLTIRFKRLKDMDKEEIEQLDFSPLDTDSVDWSDMYSAYFAFWSEPANCRHYVELRRKLTDRRSRIRQKVEDAFPCFQEDRWKVSLDLICTMVVTGGYPDYWEAVKALGEFFIRSDEVLDKTKSASSVLLAEWIEGWIDKARDTEWEHLIDPKQLANHAKRLVELQKVDDDLRRPKVLAEVMQSLGWVKGKDGWVRQ